MFDIVSEEKQNQVTERLFFHNTSTTKVYTTKVMEDYTFHYKIQTTYHLVPQVAFPLFPTNVSQILIIFIY